jgi:uncharacterized beta-barrel protein YwiB (DUF1934 family)
MKQNIFIQVKNKQEIADGEDDILDSEAQGTLYQKRDQYYLVYKDYSEGLQGARTTIKVDPVNERIFLNRAHPAKLKQIFKVGETTTGFYRIKSEKMELRIETDKIDWYFGAEEGRIKIEYKIYFSGRLATTNNLKITYKKEGVE